MTATNKLPPLAEALRDIAKRQSSNYVSWHEEVLNILADDLAPRYDARIAELEEHVEEREADMHARIRAGYDRTVADSWRAKVAELEAELAKFRELAREAHQIHFGLPSYNGTDVFPLIQRLAAHHKEPAR